MVVDSGFLLPSDELDAAGQIWAGAGPLTFVVSGGDRRPAYVGARFLASVPVSVPPQPGVTAKLTGRDLRVCVRATGTSPIRKAQFSLAFTPVPSPIADEPYAPPPIGVGQQLVAVRVAQGHCPYRL